MRTTAFHIYTLGIVLLFCSCKEETPTDPLRNEREISGRIILNTNGMYQFEDIDSVTVEVGNRTTSADSLGIWRVSGLLDDTVDIHIIKPGYGSKTIRRIYLPSGRKTTLSHTVTLYNLPHYLVSHFAITPFFKNGPASQGLTIHVETSTPPNYPDVRRIVIFFNTDSVVSFHPKEYLFQLEIEFPGQFNEYWVSSDANKQQHNLYFQQTLYAVAYPISGWEYQTDEASKRKLYSDIGAGKSERISFMLP